MQERQPAYVLVMDGEAIIELKLAELLSERASIIFAAETRLRRTQVARSR